MDRSSSKEKVIDRDAASTVNTLYKMDDRRRLFSVLYLVLEGNVCGRSPVEILLGMRRALRKLAGMWISR